MTAPVHLRAVVPDLAAWNRSLNRTHAMAAMRARSGRLVNWVEERRRRLVASRVLSVPHRTVVDLGSEDGWLSEAWAQDAERLVLVDVDPAPLDAAARRLGPGTTCAIADVTDRAALAALDVAGHADVVVLSAILEHVPDPDLALEAARTLLHARGHLVVYLPADGPILAAKAVLKYTRLGSLVRGLSLEPAPGHLHRFRRSDVAALLSRHGDVPSLTFDPTVLGYVAIVRPRIG